MIRGEIRWYTFRAPDKRRPVLLLSRPEVVAQLNELIVVPATRTIRGLTTEVVLTPDDGMPVMCALNFDHIALAQRDRVGAVICMLPDLRWLAIRIALLIACGFEAWPRPRTIDQSMGSLPTQPWHSTFWRSDDSTAASRTAAWCTFA